MSSEPKRLCIISSRADSQQVGDLVKHFHPFEEQKTLELWHLAAVPAGANIQDDLTNFLSQADGVVIWISTDLWKEDLYSLIKSNLTLLPPQAVIMPVLARRTVWESDDFLRSHASNLLPVDGQPMPTDSAEQRDAWLTEMASAIAGKIGLITPRRLTGNPFWKKKKFWGLIITGLIGLIALYFASLYFMTDNHENQEHKTLKKTVANSTDLGCGFPVDFDSTQLYILITRFEDFSNDNETECYGRGIESRIDEVKLREKLPIRICYLDSLSPNQSEAAGHLRDRYHADLIVWGKLRNAGPQCRADGFCLNFQPSDTLIHYAGGHIAPKVDNDYKMNISAADLEAGLINMGPESFDAWLIGVSNIKVGRKKPEFYRIAADWPIDKQSDEFNQRGSLFYSFHDFEKALSDYTEAIRLKPTAQKFFNRGNLEVELHQYEAALADYNQAIKCDQKYTDAYNNRGNIKIFLGEKEGAIADYDQAIQLDPGDITAYGNRGNAKSAMGQKEAAIADYDQAIQLDPKFADAYNNRGAAKSDLGQNEEAIIDCNWAIKFSPNLVSAYYNRGNAKFSLGQNESAILDYDRAIKLNPNYANAYHMRGNAKYKLGQYEAAIADYNWSIQISPNDADAYHNRGDVEYLIGEKEKAIIDYDSAIRLNPNDFTAYVIRGGIKSEIGQSAAAIVDYDLAIQINPNDAGVYYNRGVAKFDLKQMDAAIADYDLAIQINPNNAFAYINRGFVKSILGQYDAAISDYNLAIQIVPDDADTFNNRGNAYQKKEKYLAATSDFCQAFRLRYLPGWNLYIAILVTVGLVLFWKTNRKKRRHKKD